MVSWTTVVVTVCLVFMIYFLVKGIRVAFSDKELPEPVEGDYEITVIGRTHSGKLLAFMSPRKGCPEDVQ